MRITSYDLRQAAVSQVFSKNLLRARTLRVPVSAKETAECRPARRYFP